jgi:hypothetical protein
MCRSRPGHDAANDNPLSRAIRFQQPGIKAIRLRHTEYAYYFNGLA